MNVALTKTLPEDVDIGDDDAEDDLARLLIKKVYFNQGETLQFSRKKKKDCRHEDQVSIKTQISTII